MKKSQLFPTKYLSAGDLDNDTHVKITKAVQETLRSPDGDSDDKLILYFQQLTKGLPVNVTNFDSIAELHGDDSDDWIGKWIMIYPTKVQFGSKMVGRIRVRDQAPTMRADVARQEVAVKDDAISEDDIPF